MFKITGCISGSKKGMLTGLLLFLLLDLLLLTGLTAAPVRAETLRAAGLVRSVERIEKAPPAAGEIVKMNYKEGDIIDEEPLLELDRRREKLNVEVAQEQLRRAEKLLQQENSRLEAARAARDLARVRLESARETPLSALDLEVKQAGVEMNLEEQEYDRLKVLGEKNAVEENELEKARLSLEASRVGEELARAQREEGLLDQQYAVKEAEASLQEADENLSTAEAAVAAAEADLKRAEKELEQSRLEREKMELEGPEGYLVTDRKVETGEYITAGETAYEVVKDEYEIVIEPDERELSEFCSGREGKALVEAYQDRPFTVEVERVAPEVDSERGTVEVFLAVKGETPPLKPGMSVSVEFSSGAGDD
ncbi:MAG: HlyD family efflux transporter periplasmic adaptor subunit [Bacillota bacterium]